VKLGLDTEKIKKRMRIMHNKLKLNMDSIKTNLLKNKKLFKSMEKITKFIFHFFLNYSLIMFFRILILKYTNIQSQMSKKIEKKNSKIISANTTKKKCLKTKLRKSQILINIKNIFKAMMKHWIIRKFKKSWNKENSSKTG